MTRKVILTYVYPPIPVRSMDWAAHWDGDEPNDDGHMLYGSGPAPKAALADLLRRERELHPDMCPHGDKFCPCPDGAACHYEQVGDSHAMPTPIQLEVRL